MEFFCKKYGPLVLSAFAIQLEEFLLQTKLQKCSILFSLQPMSRIEPQIFTVQGHDFTFIKV